MVSLCRLAACFALALLPDFGHACEQAPALEGVLSIPQCDPASEECVPGTRAAHAALEALEIPDVFTIGVQTSPWRMYDAEGRVLTIAEVAAAVRAAMPASDRRVHLAGSWTAARPDGGGDTLAHRLSVALDGVPVDGSDGFLWLSPSGAMRTTRQAFSVWKAGPYSVARGEEVLTALVPGAMAQFEDQFARDNNAAGVVQAGIGFDVFLLCQERARSAFERAAGMGSPIGAYNAGLMHAETGDSDAAKRWLQLAARRGEAKAADALRSLPR